MATTTPTTRQARFTTPSDTELRVERAFDAPRALVWRAFTDPALVARWLGPRRYETRVETMDVRVGGKWRFLHVGADGEAFAFSGEFLEVEPPERLVQTWAFEGMPEADCVQTLQLTETDGRTTMVAVAKYRSRAHRDAHLENGMEDGAQESYQRLDELVGTMR